MNNYNEEEYPHVYMNKYYKCDFGYRGFNIPVTIQIKDGKVEDI